MIRNNVRKCKFEFETCFSSRNRNETRDYFNERFGELQCFEPIKTMKDLSEWKLKYDATMRETLSAISNDGVKHNFNSLHSIIFQLNPYHFYAKLFSVLFQFIPLLDDIIMA